MNKKILPTAQKGGTNNNNNNNNNDDDDEKPKGWRRYIPAIHINIFGPSDAAKAMMAVFDTSDGKVKELTTKLCLKSSEKKFLLNMWLEIDGDRNNKMDYFEFISYFNLNDDVWSNRTFTIMNYNATGVVSFVEFLTFCSKYLLIDLDNSIEFSFRLLSRRGDAFNRAHHSILDMNDMKHFLSARYPNKSLNKIRKRAVDIFKVLHKGGDNCAEINDFQHYCMKNAVFVKFTHHVQMHLRKCIFGMEFWVQRSRKMKLAVGTALDNLIFFNSVNSFSENFCEKNLNQPVLHLSIAEGGGIDPDAPLHEGYEEAKKTKTYHGRLAMAGIPVGDYNTDFSDIILARLTRKPGQVAINGDKDDDDEEDGQGDDGKSEMSSKTGHVVEAKSGHSHSRSQSHAGSRHQGIQRKGLAETQQKINKMTIDPTGPEYESKVCEDYISGYLHDVAKEEYYSDTRTRNLIVFTGAPEEDDESVS